MLEGCLPTREPVPLRDTAAANLGGGQQRRRREAIVVSDEDDTLERAFSPVADGKCGGGEKRFGRYPQHPHRQYPGAVWRPGSN